MRARQQPECTVMVVEETTNIPVGSGIEIFSSSSEIHSL